MLGPLKAKPPAFPVSVSVAATASVSVSVSESECLDVASSFGYLERVDERVLADLGSICAVLYSLVT